MSDSKRVTEARAHAAQRLRRQRGTLQPLGWGVIVAVVAGALGAHPALGLHGSSVGVTVAVCGFVATMGFAISARFVSLGAVAEAVVIGAMGACAVALAGLQPRGTTGLAAGAAAFVAVARLPIVPAVPLAIAVLAGDDLAAALAGASSGTIVANTLLVGLLGLMARFLKQARESQDQTELLLAQLEDARDEQARAAAIAERGRIASELHDVLAHSLSGAAIQLQGARKLAERGGVQPQMRQAIDRASELVKDGLASARQAVGALRGEALPSVAQLGTLVDSFRTDMQVDVTFTIEGSPRTLPADASLALYRGAQEALTNVARYAPGARTGVLLRYDAARTVLTVEDRVSESAPGGNGLSGVGGGRGLAGMRERLERSGGRMRAGPTDHGWRVELEVPA